MDSILDQLSGTLRASGSLSSFVTMGKQTLPSLKCCLKTSQWTLKALELLEAEEHLELDPSVGVSWIGARLSGLTERTGPDC